MHIGRFDEGDDGVAFTQGQFFARLAREQSGEGKSAIKLDAEHGAFSREGLDDAA